MNSTHTIFLSAILLLTACTSSEQEIIPTTAQLPNTEDNYSIIWVGSGKSYIYQDGKYQRSESNDYSFEVVQRRYGNSWKSIKNMHRIHPDYDGVAGKREQTMFFAIDFKRGEQGVISTIKSSLGNGFGMSDKSFRQQSLELKLANVSSFSPYNTMRISQNYQYEQGKLVELVELFKKEDGQEIPFVKIEEEANIFRPVRLTSAPTVFTDD